MPIAQILLASGGAPPTPTYTLTPATSSIDEGASLTLTVGGTNIPDGTYYWTIGTGSEDFATTDGTVSVTSNSGSFTVTPTDDATTEGSETFIVALRSVSITGTILASSGSITINDTSQTPAQASLNWPTSGNNYVTVQNTQSEWALGSTYTIEFWSKTTRSSSPSSLQTVMSQGDSTSNIDVGFQGGKLMFANSQFLTLAEPTPGGKATGAYNIGSPGGWNGVGAPGSWTELATTGGTGSGLTITVAGASGGYANALAIINPGSGYTEGDAITAVGESSVSFNINVSAAVWTHVAIVRNGSGNSATLYYNGESQGTFAHSPLTNSSNDLILGRRGSNEFQYFYGKLAMIRISNTAKYLANFDPSLSYGVESDTVLMMGNNPLVDLSTYELNGVALTNGNGANLYIPKSTYPNLNNQVRAGDTVVNADNLSSSSVVSGAVYTADPDNWGVPISPSMTSVGTVNFSGPGEHPISLQGSVSISADFPSYQSLVFNQPQGDYLYTPASADWNLGNNWTIEFWIKSNNNSASNINIPGGQWGLINQGGWYGGMPDDNCILVGMAGGYLSIGQSANGDISFAEPTTQVWTHVAIVNNGGGSAQKVYYNGVEQTPLGANYTTNGKTNTTADLYIGRLSNQYAGYASHFDGKMALVRISNTAKYLTAFTATTTYGVEADTKLFLNKVNPLLDSKSHTVVNYGATTSADFPT